MNNLNFSHIKDFIQTGKYTKKLLLNLFSNYCIKEISYLELNNIPHIIFHVNPNLSKCNCKYYFVIQKPTWEFEHIFYFIHSPDISDLTLNNFTVCSHNNQCKHCVHKYNYDNNRGNIRINYFNENTHKTISNIVEPLFEQFLLFLMQLNNHIYFVIDNSKKLCNNLLTKYEL
jgi:hypothetical protein